MTTITIEKLLDWGFCKEPVEPGCDSLYKYMDNEASSTLLYLEFLDGEPWGLEDGPWYIALQDERTDFNLQLNHIKTIEQVKQFYELLTGIDLKEITK